MISINAIWACIRYKGRKDKIKVKLERLAKEEAEMRKEQQEVFNETFTKGEIDALRGAMVSNLKCDHPRDPRHPPFHLPTAQKRPFLRAATQAASDAGVKSTGLAQILGQLQASKMNSQSI
jgi:hypothetical protein